MTQRATGQRFRQRKLSTKNLLPILRESELEQTLDDDAQRNIPKVETGVEKGEEIEHHLQAVISAQAAGSDGKAIPTRETITTSLEYEKFYPRRFKQPVSYIRFSSTVEDCIGCPYCMNAEDEIFLKSMNARRPKSSQCSEDQFEEVMNFFEETSQLRQPFAAVDNSPVLSFEEMENSYDETISEEARQFAKDIYPHWKDERLKRNNHPLMPGLKFEKNAETDDNDPYVCFRRREVRQTRKTRGRDAQVTEKLKKLRNELEMARQLMHLVKQREIGRREQLEIDRKVFEQRSAVKEVKRNLNIKGNDEDLIDQKQPAKAKPKLDGTALQRGMPGMGAKQQLSRADGRSPESDLVTLEEIKAKKADEINRIVEEHVAKHNKWNHGYVDLTWRPITPPLDSSPKRTFRSAVNEYLPTPPASITSESSGDNLNADEGESGLRQDGSVVHRYASPPVDEDTEGRVLYRLRTGRGGQLWIDRRGLKRPFAEDVDERVLDRYAFDQESDEDEEIYPFDPYDNKNMRYRMFLASPGRDAASQQAQQALQARRSLGEMTTANGRLAPPSLVRGGSSKLANGSS